MTRSAVRWGITTLTGLALCLSVLPSSVAAYPRPGRVERVSVSSNGREARPPSGAEDYKWHLRPSIDASGRYVAFASGASLTKDDADRVVDQKLCGALTGGCTDVFVRDLVAGRTILVSRTIKRLADEETDRVALDSDSWWPVVSAKGRYVAFLSMSRALTSDSCLVDCVSPQVYRHDLRSRKTVLVSRGRNGKQSKEPEAQSGLAISGNGRYVAFTSVDDGLVKGDTNRSCASTAPLPAVLPPGLFGTCSYGHDVFVRDLAKNRTHRVSVGDRGVQADGDSMSPAMSTNGRFVAFVSSSCNLTPDEALLPAARGCVASVFVHDRSKSKTQLVSRARDGSRVGAYTPTISGDGRYVAFVSASNDIVPNDRDHLDDPIGYEREDVFVFDRLTKRTRKVSVNAYGEPDLRGTVSSASIGAGGDHVAFDISPCPYLEMIRGSERCDATTAAWAKHQRLYTHSLSDEDTAELLSLDNLEWTTSDSLASPDALPVLNHDGRYVAFNSFDSGLVRGDTNDAWDTFVYDRGPRLGVGGFGGTTKPPPPDEPQGICITDDLCIPPGGSLSVRDEIDDLDGPLTERGANIYAASIGYRPRRGDLSAVIELEDMPAVVGPYPISYGFRFEVDGVDYEARASSGVSGATFALFRCLGSSLCNQVAELRGGFGTTGMRVVFSLPLREIGLHEGGQIGEVTAFSALGTAQTGSVGDLDTARVP